MEYKSEQVYNSEKEDMNMRVYYKNPKIKHVKGFDKCRERATNGEPGALYDTFETFEEGFLAKLVNTTNNEEIDFGDLELPEANAVIETVMMAMNSPN